jgi:XTP/dITP diphosphohydrolase
MPRQLPSTIAVATNNAAKLREIAEVLVPHGIQLVAAGAIVAAWTVDETGVTFAENARTKALDLARRTGVPALGDDSGLEVDALDGRPGVRSARYAGEAASDTANVRKLLDELRDVPVASRRAAFRCALALAWPDGELLEVDGRCDGTIAFAPRGFHGFGYDSVFLDPATGLTFAELADDRKHERSHRGRALVALRRELGER